MASKLYPDVLNHIFEYNRDDINTLHSILLVNRFWAKVVVNLLWENPFRYAHIQVKLHNHYIYKTYDKLLNIYRHFINDNNTLLFDYPSFLKILDWKYLRCEDDGVQLFNMFIRKSTKITTLKINNLNRGIEKYFTRDEEILRCVKSLSHIKTLKINNKIPSYWYLEIFSDIFNDLNSLSVDCYITDDNFLGLSEFIQAQKNLKILIIRNFFPLINEGLKAQSNSIKYIKLANNRFKGDANTLTSLKYCLSLETLEFSFWNLRKNDCQILSKISFPNLKSLIFDHSKINYEDLINIIKINGSNLNYLCLTNLNFLWSVETNSIELNLIEISKIIKQFCSKLSIFKLQTYWEHNSIIYFFHDIIINLDLFILEFLKSSKPLLEFKAPINLDSILSKIEELK
ncbi:hypothetical protein RclHR1_03360007 [Rhizophagus clarus]|uniref:F-box domain-containing protein n=1 Tax=Rhizophagus clarus TaxID=94130 RepID=A0A2Z6RA28_9GLOM|nr:hypothetical protein RclHR1_03360007 [Rhizophagus clarus]GES95810.1 hypothetical protein GLOIN_2v1510288 [Rhizophagus clarus]